MTRRGHRDFGSSNGEHQAAKPGLTFTLNGEEFETLGSIPAGAANDLSMGITLDEQGNRVHSPPNIIAFLTRVLREWETVPLAVARQRGADVDDEDVEWLTFEEARRRGVDTADVGEGDASNGTLPVVRLATDDVPRFNRLMYDKEEIVEVKTLGEVMVWIAEELSDRPFTPSVVSRRGRR